MCFEAIDLLVEEYTSISMALDLLVDDDDTRVRVCNGWEGEKSHGLVAATTLGFE